ncbi:MAG TPA: prolipoprotein diacylglyceryl transferase family protein [Polyangiaceae bacterium]|nr:prolipoprotein diacylglyceryl transferase family protein [Polyangiaceae bacterium]
MSTAFVAAARERAPRAAWTAAAIVVLYTAFFFGVLPALLWALGAAFDRGFALVPLSPTFLPLGAVSFAAGTLLMLASMRTLVARGRGLPISHLPPHFLVARGVYARLRHPIYVGYALALCGAGLHEQSAGRGVLAPLFLWAGTLIYARGFEEPRLLARFGPAYADYARTTPLLPVPFAAELAALGQRLWLAARPGVERLANRTVLFRAGSSVWVTYGALVALGGVTGAMTAAPLLAGLGLPPARIALYELGLTAAMLAGGRLVWLIYEWRRVWAEPSIVLRRVGFVSFGGYAGFLLFTFLFARLSHLSALALFDRTLPPAFLISAWGRLGCLSYGCCYGRPCRHGLRWRDPQSKVNREQGSFGAVPRVPTPLLAAGSALLVAALGFALLARGALPGAISASVLLAYSTLRFAVEHFRDEPRLSGLTFTKGQLLSSPIAALALALLIALPPGTVAPAGADASVLPTLAPVFAAVGVLAFLVCGFHRKEVGRW